MRTCRLSLDKLKAHVQGIANSDPQHTAAIIFSAGMRVRKPRTWINMPTKARQGDTSGRVALYAKALPRPVSYRWQMSTDQQTWTDLPETFMTKLIVNGLTPATMYWFRLRTVTKVGPSEWSPPISLIVH